MHFLEARAFIPLRIKDARVHLRELLSECAHQLWRKKTVKYASPGTVNLTAPIWAENTHSKRNTESTNNHHFYSMSLRSKAIPSRSQWKPRPLKFHLSRRLMPHWGRLHVVSAACRMQVSSFLCVALSPLILPERWNNAKAKRTASVSMGTRALCSHSKSRRCAPSAVPLYLLFGINCQKHASADIRHHSLCATRSKCQNCCRSDSIWIFCQLPSGAKTTKWDFVKCMARVSCFAPSQRVQRTRCSTQCH